MSELAGLTLYCRLRFTLLNATPLEITYILQSLPPFSDIELALGGSSALRQIATILVCPDGTQNRSLDRRKGHIPSEDILGNDVDTVGFPFVSILIFTELTTVSVDALVRVAWI